MASRAPATLSGEASDASDTLTCYSYSTEHAAGGGQTHPGMVHPHPTAADRKSSPIVAPSPGPTAFPPSCPTLPPSSTSAVPPRELTSKSAEPPQDCSAPDVNRKPVQPPTVRRRSPRCRIPTCATDLPVLPVPCETSLSGLTSMDAIVLLAPARIVIRRLPGSKPVSAVRRTRSSDGADSSNSTLIPDPLS